MAFGGKHRFTPFSLHEDLNRKVKPAAGEKKRQCTALFSIATCVTVFRLPCVLVRSTQLVEPAP